MATSQEWQLAGGAAERYASVLVPTILGPAAEALVRWVVPRPGEVVLDLGCGTGAATRAAARAVGSAGHVFGVDVQPGMLDVAARTSPIGGTVEWIEGSALTLPLPDHSVTLALGAQVLQFLPDRASALRELKRVLQPGGRLALSLWAPRAESPWFDHLVRAVEAEIGPDVAGGLDAAFALTDAAELESLLASAGLTDVESTHARLDLPIPGGAQFVRRHVAATPMAAGFTAAPGDVQEAVVARVAEGMRGYERGQDYVVPFTLLLGRARR